MSRKNTQQLLEKVYDGELDPYEVITALCLYLSDEQVGEVVHNNEFEYSYDEDDGNALASAGWGTDEDYMGTPYED